MPVRPKSIVQFERVYWAIILIGVVSTAVRWNAVMATVDMQRMVAMVGMAPVYGLALFVIGVQLLLWYFIARRGSAVAKWILVVLTVLGLVMSGLSLAARGFEEAVPAILEIVQLVLQVVMLVLLFRPDTRTWFGEDAAAA